MKRLALALIASILPLAAQTSSLQGTITDAQGAVIPAAIVTATNQDTSASRMALTDEKGSYSFLQMQPGSYKVDVQKPGFNVFNAEVRLQINTPSTLDVQMQVGQAAESVSVTAEITSINTENASIGSPFMEVQIKQLPLQTRNVVELLSLQPGVAPTGEVLGAKRDQNNVTLDGVDVNDNQNSGITTSTSSGFNAGVPVPLDSVQEFRTTVAGQGADQGRSSGGQVSLVTKGGSNAFHGSLYEYNRNTLMAANNWFSNRAGIGRQPLVRNQYGASLGGRLIRDRAFFFFNWEDRKDRSATAVTRTVPTESFKQGIVKVQMANGQVVSLAPTDVASVDPLHLGGSSTMLNYLKQYPAGNDPLSSPDKGLNFSTLRFNAPQTLNNRAYVSRLDFNLDRNGRHSLMLRGSLNSAAQDLSTALAQFPGQDAVQRQVDNSRGLAARYTAVLSPRIVNVFSYGYTRIGLATTGSSLVAPTFFTTALLPTGNNVRPSNRIAPTTNLVNDTTWTAGRHTVQFGMNLRFIQNDRTAYNNLPNYSFNRNTLKGLGADISASVLSYIQQSTGTSSKLQSGTNVTNAMGTLLGLINQYGATYNFDATGTAIPFGSPVVRSFTNHESEFYVQDSFHWKPNLTLTYGLRYSLFGVPYETNGVQVVPETPLSQYFADRVGGQEAGIPGYALPTAKITYNLGGPVNGGPGWYPLDKNNFAPRFALAWSPDDKTMAGKIMGKGSVIRAGAGVVYDRYGGNMTVSFANTGSPGLASTVSQPLNTDFTTAYRWDGSNVPALPAAPSGGFPFTPPTVVGGFTSFTGISPDLKAPYSYLLNLTYARPLPKKMTLEIGYVGRLSHKGLLQQDFSQPLTQFKDPRSGMTWTQASGIIRALYDSGITPAQVKANPAILPQIPFFENMFAKAKDYQINGSATANYFYTVYQTYAGSDLDALNDMDRLRLKDGTCIAAPGCNTFFALQSAGLQSWVNAGKSAFHGLQVVLRRPFSNGWGYDFNYTWSHSIDNASGSESAGGLTNSGTIIQDAFNPNSFRGPSDFDIRHNITANVVGELPFGKGKAILGGAPKWLDQIVGGWQISSLITYRTGTPLNIINGGVYPTNYLNAAIGILQPGAAMPAYGTYDQTGAPNLFTNTSAVNAFEGQYPGLVGTRGILRGPSFFNVDLSVAKYINLPFEGQRLQLRGEAFNAFNTVNFGYTNANSSLSLATPATFGQYTQASAARVMQFALRYEF